MGFHSRPFLLERLRLGSFVCSPAGLRQAQVVKRSSIAAPSSSSPATGLSMGPPAGDGAELQFAFAPFHAPELAGLNLVLQILCGLEQRGFERVVSGLGVQGQAMNQQRSLARMAGGLGVHARTWYLQPH